MLAITEQRFAKLNDHLSERNPFRQPMQQSGVDQPEKENDKHNAGGQQNKREVLDVERRAPLTR